MVPHKNTLDFVKLIFYSRVFIAEQIFVQQLVSKKTGVTVIVRVSQKQMSLHHSQHTFE